MGEGRERRNVAAQDPPPAATSGGVNLKREVGLVSGIGLIVGTMIGSGIFISPKGVLERTGSVGLSLTVWASCGLLSMLGAFCYVELGIAVPSSGGEYSYLLAAFPEVVAYFYAWTSIMVIRPSVLAIICLGLGEYVADSVWDVACADPASHRAVVKLFGAATIVTITFINCYSVRLATSIQNFFTAAKLLALAIIIIGGLVRIIQGHTEALTTAFDNTQTKFSDIALAFYSGLWAYDGWNNLNFATEEIKNPVKNLPLSIIIGIPLVTIVYILTNIAYFTAMSTEELLSSNAVAVTFGSTTLGTMAWIVPMFVIMSTFGAANGSCFAAGRLCYVAAREGHLVDVLSFVHAKYLTPAPALIFNAIVALLMVVPSDIGSLIDFFSFTAWVFYGLTFLSLIVLRYTARDLERPYKVPLLIPVIVCISSVYLVVGPIVEDPAVEYLYAVIFILAGLLFYIPFVRFKLHESRLKFCGTLMNKITVLLQHILVVCPPTCCPE